MNFIYTLLWPEHANVCVLHLKGIPEAMGFNNVSNNLGKCISFLTLQWQDKTDKGHIRLVVGCHKVLQRF